MRSQGSRAAAAAPLRLQGLVLTNLSSVPLASVLTTSSGAAAAAAIGGGDGSQQHSLPLWAFALAGCVPHALPSGLDFTPHNY